MKAPSLSIVIPVLEDTAALARLLEHLRGQDSAGTLVEIIVVDGARDARCAALCRDHGVRYLAADPGRGRQLNLGAAAAGAQVLWFLHADAEPAAGSLQAIDAALARGAVGGAFRFHLPGTAGLAPRLIELGVMLRCRFGGIAYGDQGLFVRTASFAACGGFADTGLFEEVPLVRGLRRRGMFALLPMPIGVSPRRWQRDGWWRCIVRNRTLALGHMLGVPPARLAGWYRPRRSSNQAGQTNTEDPTARSTEQADG